MFQTQGAQQSYLHFTHATEGESAEMSTSRFGLSRNPGGRFTLLAGPGVGQTEEAEMAEAANRRG